MNRLRNIEQLRWQNKPFDVAVIGGGATGTGIALDATTRGFSTLLLEQSDFGKGTSSRSTKLLHGGVRYLAKGDIGLVTEALRERGIIMKNAPHLAGNQEFVIPVYSRRDAWLYATGLRFYDMLAGGRSLGPSRYIGREATLEKLPTVNPEGLLGGVAYHDGQFDDTRMLLALLHRFEEEGGVAVNYCRMTGLVKDSGGLVRGVHARDMETGETFQIEAHVVFNATGVFADEVAGFDNPSAPRTLKPSQGIHLVLDKSFLNSETALMIPKTSDGRVLFAIPWHNRVVMGTTDTPVHEVSLEPRALESEISFILSTAASCLTKKPSRSDVLCVFAGLRPLAADPDNPGSTRELSRRHKVRVSKSGLVSVEGGKWTTYRKMAEDAINKAMQKKLLPRRPCVTADLFIEGPLKVFGENHLNLYGRFATEIETLQESLPGGKMLIHPSLPYSQAEVHWICRNESPRKLEDILARRTRALLLNARASLEMAPAVAVIMAEELGLNGEWMKTELDAYEKLCSQYLL